MSHLKSSHR